MNSDQSLITAKGKRGDEEQRPSGWQSTMYCGFIIIKIIKYTYQKTYHCNQHLFIFLLKIVLFFHTINSDYGFPFPYFSQVLPSHRLSRSTTSLSLLKKTNRHLRSNSKIE